MELLNSSPLGLAVIHDVLPLHRVRLRISYKHRYKQRSYHLRAIHFHKKDGCHLSNIYSKLQDYSDHEVSPKFDHPFPETAAISAEGVKLREVGNTETGEDLRSSTDRNSDSVDIRSERSNIFNRISKFNSWWKSIHEAYHEDNAVWGFGSSPIFIVYEGSDGKVEKVVVNENEIRRRQGVEPLFLSYADASSLAQADEMITMAHTMAKDIENGSVVPKKFSTVYSVVKSLRNGESKFGYQKLVNQANFVAHKTVPYIKTALLIAMPIYGICVIWGAFQLKKEQSGSEISSREASAQRLDALRKMKAQIDMKRRDTSSVETSLAPAEFMERLLEVRKMARQVRLEEAQKSAVDEEIDIEPQSGMKNIQQTEEFGADNASNQTGLPVTVTNPVDSIAGKDLEKSEVTAQEIEQEMVTNSTEDDVRDIGNGSSLLNEKVRNSVEDNVSLKRSQKKRPRFILSLEEAKAVLGDKKVLPSHSLKPEISQVSLNGANMRGDQVLHSPQSSLNVQGDQVFNTDYAVSSSSEETDAQSITATYKEIQRVKTAPNSQNMSQKQDVSSSDPSGVQRLLEGSLENKPQTVLIRDSDGWKDPNKAAALGIYESAQKGNQMDTSDILSFKSTKSSNDPSYNTHKTKQSLLKEYHMNGKTKDIVGSGQPVIEEAKFSNAKRWSKELWKKYNSETDPDVRKLITTIGSDLDSWVTEEEIKAAERLASSIEQGKDFESKKFLEVQKKIQEEKEKFGMEAVLEKYKEYKPNVEDQLWWLDLQYVLCFMVVSVKQGVGLYGLDMSIDFEEGQNQTANHIIAFQDRKDAMNFCRLFEKSTSRFKHSEVCPFSPKELYRIAREEGFRVTVLRTGEVQATVEQTLEELEDKIVEIGSKTYWDKLERDHSIDIDSILHQRFGL